MLGPWPGRSGSTIRTSQCKLSSCASCSAFNQLVQACATVPRARWLDGDRILGQYMQDHLGTCPKAVHRSALCSDVIGTDEAMTFVGTAPHTARYGTICAEDERTGQQKQPQRQRQTSESQPSSLHKHASLLCSLHEKFDNIAENVCQAVEPYLVRDLNESGRRQFIPTHHIIRASTPEQSVRLRSARELNHDACSTDGMSSSVLAPAQQCTQVESQNATKNG